MQLIHKPIRSSLGYDLGVPDSLMLNRHAVGKWSGRLALSQERDFERLVLPFLRVHWPAIEQVPARQGWDRKGVDLLPWTAEPPFAVGVQCKGFSVHELGASQIDQALKSIDAFEHSDIQCTQFILLHNRDGRNRDFVRIVENRLRRLVMHGRVTSAQLWDRKRLLDEACQALKRRIDSALRKHSTQLLESYRVRIPLSEAYVSVVPLTEARLVFRRDEPCSVEAVGGTRPRRAANWLVSDSEARWTLLTGDFGVGKTTTVLQAAQNSPQILILVPANRLPSRELRRGTTLFLEQVVGALDVLSDFIPEDRLVLEELAGPVLSHLLERPNNDYVLVLDGLDENRAYSNLEGLETLSNQLSDLRCPIILTTRQEHLRALFGNFSQAFQEFSTKNRPNRKARLLTLENWGIGEVRKLLSVIPSTAFGKKRSSIGKFARLLDTGDAHRFYGDLLFRPLFLQFILEDVVENGVRKADRNKLLGTWAERKIRRDISARGLIFEDYADIEAYVAAVMNLMEDAAHVMTAPTSSAVELAEAIMGSELRKLATGYFKSVFDPLLGILLNSVLVPLGLPQRGDLRIGFAFRVFHEYFLARYLKRNGVPGELYPPEVQGLLTSMTAS
jgi:hypothetical protein